MISSVNAETKLVCLLGNPARHSFSPLIHNAAFKALGINTIYLAFEVESVTRAISGLRELQVLGFNVTAPFKIDALTAVDVIDPIAEHTGSMNTGYWKNDLLHGTNTDVLAIQKGLKGSNFELADSKILIFGSGGAARAVLTACQGSQFMIINRTPSRTRELVKEFAEENISVYQINDLPTIIKQVEIIINATPVGRKTNETWIPPKFIKSSQLIIDLVYRKGSTQLITDAKAKGAKTIDGIEFLISQGIESFKLWTSRNPPIEVMKKAVLQEQK